jgi:HAD superfamily hydrolase (TIGR01549 family)
MVKALFLDLDETLCDTTGANNKALEAMAQCFDRLFGHNNSTNSTGVDFAEAYRKGIYRELTPAQEKAFLPVNDEEAFRHALIASLLKEANISDFTQAQVLELQNAFDDSRTAFFDFFDGIEELLLKLKKQFTLVVITNGPEFSQVAKVERVKLSNYVDHIIIGGQEPEQKPAVSIFNKALKLAHCNKHDVIHFGDSLACDIKGANDAGIRSVWIRHGQENNNPDIVPDFTIEHPSDIPEFIKQHIQASL